jgi:hypothetical protein
MGMGSDKEDYDTREKRLFRAGIIGLVTMIAITAYSARDLLLQSPPPRPGRTTLPLGPLNKSAGPRKTAFSMIKTGARIRCRCSYRPAISGRPYLRT